MKKLSRQSAMASLNSFLDRYDIEYSELGETEKRAADGIVRAIEKGRIEFLENGSVKQNLKNPIGSENAIKEIVYGELTGQAKLECDKYKLDEGVHRQQALLGMLSKMGIDTIQQLKAADLSTAESLSALFFLL